MIQDQDQYKVEGNLTGQKIAMGIDESSMAHIMHHLANLYSNRPLAVVREYGTNAWDAHVEAGVTRAIEVTLPSALTPFFKVKDFGVGLTVEDIHSIYSQYGASTKRGTNAQNGMLGFGCKSALAYCSQFTVASVKDGTKIVVNVGRDEDGGGSMTVVDTLTTTEANGTEITVPVRRTDTHVFEREAREFYGYWAAGTVLINGAAPKLATDGAIKLTDDLYLIDSHRESKIVMGNVAYPAPELDEHVTRGSLIAFVPIGSVSFPPSREALMDTKNTRATLEATKNAYDKYLRESIQRDIDAAATPMLGLRVLRTRLSLLPQGLRAASNYTYNGVSFPAAYVVPGSEKFRSYYDHGCPTVSITQRGGYGNLSYCTKAKEVPALDWPNTVWVTDFAPEKYTANHKHKMRKWAEQNGITDFEQFVLCKDSGPTSAFIEPARIVAWDTVKAIKLDRTVSASGALGKIPGSFEVWTESGFDRDVKGDDLRLSYPIYWYHGNRWESKEANSLLGTVHTQYTLVCLPGNRLTKFQRDVPQAKKFWDAVHDLSKAEAAKFSDDERKALMLDDRGERVELAKLDRNRVKDPILKDGVRIANIDVTKITAARRRFSRLVQVDSWDIKYVSPLDAYPLFSVDVLRRNPKHVYDYLNGVYGK